MFCRVLVLIAVCVLSTGTIQPAVCQNLDSRDRQPVNWEEIRSQANGVVSQMNMDLGTLHERIAKDRTLADLIGLARKEGGGSPHTAMEFTYKDGQIVSFAVLSDNSPVLFLLTTGPAFSGRAVIVEMKPKKIRCFDSTGSLEIGIGDGIIESGLVVGNSRFWDCVWNCIAYYSEQDWFISFLMEMLCPMCLDAPSWYTCMPCGGVWIGLLGGCMQRCRTPNPPFLNYEPSAPAPAEIIDVGQQPFNPISQITFRLQQKENVDLRIYNILGQEVTTLMSGPVQAGIHKVTFNGSNYSSGLYLCVLKTPTATDSKRLMLVK